MITQDVFHIYAIDNGTQWFSFAARIKELGDINKSLTVEDHVPIDSRTEDSPFCRNIISRKKSFTDLRVEIGSQIGFYGWYISEEEYNKLVKAQELLKGVEEYDKLLLIKNRRSIFNES